MHIDIIKFQHSEAMQPYDTIHECITHINSRSDQRENLENIVDTNPTGLKNSILDL